MKNSIKYLQQSKLIFFSFLLSFNCYGAITIVNPSADPYADIQEALILAEPGDIVRLTAGFYELEDSLSIDVENIRLEGEGIDKTVLSFKNQKSGAQGLSVTSDNVVLQDFAIEDAKGDALVLNKWFAIQASASVDKLLDLVQDLKKHPDFTMTNPNRCRSLVQVFAGSKHFHATDGAGYAFLADNIIELDVEINNPQVAARMAGVFSRWRKYGPERQILMKAQLERIKNTPGLSKDTLEVVSRSLK